MLSKNWKNNIFDFLLRIFLFQSKWKQEEKFKIVARKWFSNSVSIFFEGKLRKFKGESRFDEMERGEKSKLGEG